MFEMLSRALPPRSHRSRRRVSPLRTAGREKAAAIFRLTEVAAKPFCQVTTVHEYARHRLLNRKCCQISKAGDNFLTLPLPTRARQSGADQVFQPGHNLVVLNNSIVNLRSLNYHPSRHFENGIDQ
jgi:hypothetical protein